MFSFAQEMEVDSEDEDTGLENFSLEDDLFSQEEPRTSRRLEPLSIHSSFLP